MSTSVLLCKPIFFMLSFGLVLGPFCQFDNRTYESVTSRYFGVLSDLHRPSASLFFCYLFGASVSIAISTLIRACSKLTAFSQATSRRLDY